MKYKMLIGAVILSAVLAGCSSAPPAEELEAQAKWALPHFNPNGGPSGRIHWLDQELYNELVDIILSKGGLPTPENVDNLYDCHNGLPGCG